MWQATAANEDRQLVPPMRLVLQYAHPLESQKPEVRLRLAGNGGRF
ncbi:MAG TPA: hypothetical protein VFZ34_32110 [Blastocatellia bacterium]|nr:hypothetical protein [Blastocatellia bacterium]